MIEMGKKKHIMYYTVLQFFCLKPLSKLEKICMQEMCELTVTRERMKISEC